MVPRWSPEVPKTFPKQALPLHSLFTQYHHLYVCAPATLSCYPRISDAGGFVWKKLSVLGAGRMKLSVLGTSGGHLGPSGDHHSKKLSIFNHFSSTYVIFSQKHIFQILDAHFPKRFRLKPHINQKNLKKVSNIHVFKKVSNIHFLKKSFPILIPILIQIFPLKSIEIYPF